jgi:Flp pilus assembly protein TadD
MNNLKEKRLNIFAIYFFLLIITLSATFPLLKADFVHWDDDVYIVDNDRVKQGITLDNVKWAFSTIYFGFYYPLTWLSHMLDCTIYGLSPTGHHLTNIIIYFLNVLLVFEFFKRLSRDNLKSFTLSSLFAAHPLNIESVGWISERKNLLAFFFFFLALNFYLKYVSNSKAVNYFWTYLFYMLGMVSKPILVTFPFALLLLDYYPLNRISLKKNFYKENRREIVEKIYLMIPIPLFIYLTIVAQKEADAIATLSNIPLKDRIAGAIIAIKDYVFSFFFPLKLTALYPHLRNHYSVFSLLFSLALILILTIAFLKLYKKRPIYIVGWLWFLLNLSPTIGIIQAGDQSRADRYMYIPMLGLLMIIIFGIFEEKDIKRKLNPKITLTFFFIALSLLTLKSNYQARTWKNTETLFTNMLKVSPNASQAYQNLAIIRKSKGDIMGAIEYYKKAIEIDPGKAKSYNNLGSCYADIYDYENAELCFKQAIECDPKMSQPFHNLGILYKERKDYFQAVEYYKKVIEIKPDKADAYNNIGSCYIALNDVKSALSYFEKAYSLSKEKPSIVFNYALANEMLGYIDLAEELYEKTLALDKKHITSRINLASIKIKKGKLDEAQFLIEEGLLLYPDNNELKNLRQSLKKN